MDDRDTPVQPDSDAALPKTESDLKEIVEEYEGKTRRLGGGWGTLAGVLAVAMSLYHLYAANVPIVRQVHLVRHLLFVLVLTFLLYPGTRRTASWKRPTLVDIALALASLVALAYVLIDFEAFIYRSYVPTALDLVFGTMTILLVIEATRRTVGNALALIVIAFIAYALIGDRLPEPWTHKGYDLIRIIGQLFITLEGIFGVPLEVSATFIILFTIYGAVLEASGAGKFFVDLALALTGRRRTGPGQAVTVASFLLGGPSGSGVATTVTVGAITYPMLKRAGYDKESAGGLLSAGGIGATISPPILGAAAFIIAEILKISYLTVIVLAIIPTILYYFSIVLMIELDAKRMDLKRVEIAAGDARALAMRYWYLLSALVVIPLFMIIGFTAIKAVFWSIVVAIATSLLRRETSLLSVRRAAAEDRGAIVSARGLRLGGIVIDPGKFVGALDAGSRQVLNVGVTTAAAGIVVGIVNLTGLGLKLSDIIVTYAGGQLVPTLIFAAIALWVLGLALPITATYIIAAVIVAPALTKLGVSELAAHMFIFYYAVLSEVSPPVGLAPLAASALTGGRPFRTMMMAWKYTLPAFVVPFMFTTNKAGMGLLLQAPWPTVAHAAAIAALGLVALAGGLTGWLVRRASTVERAALIIAGLILITPGAVADLAGAGLLAAVAVYQWITRGAPDGTGVALRGEGER
jgi:TRAP transporter 4TM/12TM fusion protein